MTATNAAAINSKREFPSRIKLDPEQVKWWPLEIEADLLLKVGQDSFLATAPRWAFNADQTTVSVACIRKGEGKIMIFFPPTSLGTSILSIPEDELPGIWRISGGRMLGRPAERGYEGAFQGR